eukprot:COSAG02_NODE_63400_length_263_cov_0.634146_2_plen_62_part_01
MITAFVFHWSAIKQYLAPMLPGDWCQSLVPDVMPTVAGSGSGTAADFMDDPATTMVVVGDAC